MKRTSTILAILAAVCITGCSFTKDPAPQAGPTPVTPKELSNDLFNAVLKSDYDSIRELLKGKVDLDLYDTEGFTVLMRAVQIKNPISVGLLLDANAKIYFPRKDEPTTTSITIALSTQDQQIIGMFEAQRIELVDQTIKLFKAKDYRGASDYIRAQMLPYNSLGTNGLPLVDSLVTSLSENLTVKHQDGLDLLGTFIVSNARTDNTQPILQIISRFKDAKLFEVYLDHEGPNGYLYGRFSQDDAGDISWIITKLEILKRKDLRLRMGDREFLAKNIGDCQSSKSVSISTSIRLVLSLPIDETDKYVFMSAVLDSFINKLGSDAAFVLVIQDALNSWVATGLQASQTYSYSRQALGIVNALIEGKKISKDDALLLFEQVFKFSTGTEDHLAKAYEVILMSDLDAPTKSELIAALLSKSVILPSGIVAFAISHGGIDAAKQFIDSGKFTADRQENAISAAFAYSDDPATIQNTLKILLESGLTLANKESKDALAKAFEKLWNNGGQAYASLIEFMVRSSPSVLSKFTNEELADLLKRHIDNVRLTKKNWQTTQLIVTALGNMGQDRQYESILKIEGHEHEVRVSLSWLFVLAMYEVYTENPNQLPAMLTTLGTITKRFGRFDFSMSFSEKGADTSVQMLENPVALSALFSLTKAQILSAINQTFPSYPMNAKGLRRLPTSYETLAHSDIFSYYSQYPEFWSKVFQSISVGDVVLPKFTDRSHIDFLTILFGANRESTIPTLRNLIAKSTFELAESEMYCVVDQGTMNEQHLKEIESGDRNRTDEDYAPLGFAIPLMALKERTCSLGLPVTDEEAKFIQEYVLQAIRPIFPSGNEFQNETNKWYYTHSCETAYRDSIEKEVLYSPIGAIVEKRDSLTQQSTPLVSIAPQVTVGAPNACRTYLGEDYAVYNAQSAFLSSWYKCAIDKGDGRLTRTFEKLKDNLAITSDGDSGTLKQCY